MRKWHRSALGLVALSGVLVAAPVANAAPRCDSRHLALLRLALGTSGSFHEHLDLAFRNDSAGACAIGGYVTLKLLDSHGKAVHAGVSHAPGSSKMIVLHHAESAVFSVLYDGSTPCSQSVSARQLLVTPPRASRVFRLRQSLDICAPAQITLQPLRPAPVSFRHTPEALAIGGFGRAQFRRKPRRIIYTGDGSGLLASENDVSGGLSWTTWTATQASADGADWLDDCIPDCADGTFQDYPAVIELSRPRRVDGHLQFTRMTVTYLDAPPPYSGYRNGFVTFRLSYNSHDRSIFWNL